MVQGHNDKNGKKRKTVRASGQGSVTKTSLAIGTAGSEGRGFFKTMGEMSLLFLFLAWFIFGI